MSNINVGPQNPLPYCDAFANVDDYVDSLLDFVGTDELLRTLCGGVHVLDFFTSTPDLYTQVLPQEWRSFFAQHDVMDILDLLMRDDLTKFTMTDHDRTPWREELLPPASLVDYVGTVRKHLLLREPAASRCARNRQAKKLSRNVAVGMNMKKIHEVGAFASYVDDLTSTIASTMGRPITHLVDFGSGQNYLGRALASQPFKKSIVAIESRAHNVQAAKDFDVKAKVTKKKHVVRNKKAFRAGLEGPEMPKTFRDEAYGLPTPPPDPNGELANMPDRCRDDTAKLNVEVVPNGAGSIQYVEHRIEDGGLAHVVSQILPTGPWHAETHATEPNLMVISLHSCGNLIHHGLRSLILNPSVSAVAMIGCCYNLVTERLGPATYKLPNLRPNPNPRLYKTGSACDPHGFPMSKRLCSYSGPNSYNKGLRLNMTARVMAIQAPKNWSERQRDLDPDAENEAGGVKLNITARMMAVQAQNNWGSRDSEGFFKRHFYRALLQRIFLDRGVVPPPSSDCIGSSPLGHSSGTPIVIGSLRKTCYETFVNYVRGALAKLIEDPERGGLFREKMEGLSDEDIEGYQERYRERKKELSVIWSLMAFSAGVVEATIVVDRWLWLTEQEEVEECWVESVFDYGISPRNLIVVGIKKPTTGKDSAAEG